MKMKFDRKKQKRLERQFELLKMFDGDFYQEKFVSGEWYIKNYNGTTGRWQVSVYSELSYRRYKSYIEHKDDDVIIPPMDKNFKRPTLANLHLFISKK